jgi:hypothetical protein
VFVKTFKPEIMGLTNSIADNFKMDKVFKEILPKEIAIMSKDPYYSMKSKHFTFKIEEELDFWRRSQTAEVPKQ